MKYLLLGLVLSLAACSEKMELDGTYLDGTYMKDKNGKVYVVEHRIGVQRQN